MRRQYLVAWVAALLGIGSAGPVVLAKELSPLELQQVETSRLCFAPYVPIPSKDDVKLCISPRHQIASLYQDAIVMCTRGVPDFPSGLRGRIATFEDLTLVYFTGGDSLTANEFASFGCSNSDTGECWLGNITGDGVALVVSRDVSSPNDPDRFDFDSARDRSHTPGNERTFFCAHDPLDPRVVD
jgi:hypothetical protein